MLFEKIWLERKVYTFFTEAMFSRIILQTYSSENKILFRNRILAYYLSLLSVFFT